MNFRVTSVACEETAAPMRAITAKLEDWLNAALGNADFGSGVDQFAIVIISVSDESSDNERYVKVHSKLGNYKSITGLSATSYLSVAVEVPPASVAEATFEGLLAVASQAAIKQLSLRPKRLPRGYDYPRLSAAVTVALQAYARAGA